MASLQAVAEQQKRLYFKQIAAIATLPGQSIGTIPITAVTILGACVITGRITRYSQKLKAIRGTLNWKSAKTSKQNAPPRGGRGGANPVHSGLGNYRGDQKQP